MSTRSFYRHEVERGAVTQIDVSSIAQEEYPVIPVITSSGFEFVSPDDFTYTLEDNAVTTAKILDGAVTVDKINDGAITVEKLKESVVPVDGGLALSRAYASASADGANVHLNLCERQRVVIIIVEVVDVFADGDGAQPTFALGIDGGVTALTRFFSASDFTDAAAGTKFYAAGTINANCSLVVTKGGGTGTTQTGALNITAIAV